MTLESKIKEIKDFCQSLKNFEPTHYWSYFCDEYDGNYKRLTLSYIDILDGAGNFHFIEARADDETGSIVHFIVRKDLETDNDDIIFKSTDFNEFIKFIDENIQAMIAEGFRADRYASMLGLAFSETDPNDIEYQKPNK